MRIRTTDNLRKQIPIMIRMPRFTPEEMKRLDQQSAENMLVFYEKEMRRIARGTPPSSFMSKPLIKRFIAMGILERVWEKKYWSVILSQKGKEWYAIQSP